MPLSNRCIRKGDDNARRQHQKEAWASSTLTKRKFCSRPDGHQRVAGPLANFVYPATCKSEQPAHEPPQEKWLTDTWSALQDIWYRLGAFCTPSACHHFDGIELVFADAGLQDWDQEVSELIALAINPHSYRWCQEGQQGDLLQSAEMSGRNLIVRLASISQIARWPEGLEIVSEFRSYLMQIGSCLNKASVGKAGPFFVGNVNGGLPK